MYIKYIFIYNWSIKISAPIEVKFKSLCLKGIIKIDLFFMH